MRALNFRGLNIVVLFNKVSRMRAFNFHGLNIVVCSIRSLYFRKASTERFHSTNIIIDYVCVYVYMIVKIIQFGTYTCTYMSFGRTVGKHYSYLANVYSYNLQHFFTLLIVVYDQ